MSGTVHKELRPLVRAALRAGWRQQSLRNGLRLLAPDGKTAIAHGSTQSRGSIVRNFERDLRKGGLDV